MEGAHWLRTPLTAPHCAPCRPPHAASPSAPAGRGATALVTAVGRGRAARLEVGELAESPPGARSPSLGPADVLAMRRFLRRFNGDFRPLFGADGRAGGRLGA